MSNVLGCSKHKISATGCFHQVRSADRSQQLILTLCMEHNCMRIHKHNTERFHFQNVVLKKHHDNGQSPKWVMFISTYYCHKHRLCSQVHRLTSPHLNCHSSVYIIVSSLSLIIFNLKHLLMFSCVSATSQTMYRIVITKKLERQM